MVKSSQADKEGDAVVMEMCKKEKRLQTFHREKNAASNHFMICHLHYVTEFLYSAT